MRLLAETPSAIRKRADASFEAGTHDEALLSYRKLLGKNQSDLHAMLANASFGAEQITETRTRLAAFDPTHDGAYHLADCHPAWTRREDRGG